MPTDILTDLEAAIFKLKIEEPHVTVTEIAARLGKSRRHVSELMNSDPLRRELDDARQEALDAAREVLLDGSLKAAKTLVYLMEHGDTDHTRRLAALNVLQVLQRRGESGDIGDEEWESVIAQSGAVATKRVQRRIEAGEDEEDPDAN